MSEQEVKFEISPAKINECLKSYSLKGKRLKNILIDSTIFNFGEESLCSTVYDSLIRIYGEEYSQKNSDIENINGNFLFERWIETDNDVVFLFDDGTCLVFVCAIYPEYTIRFVKFDESLLDEEDIPDVDLSKMFRFVIGMKISGFNVNQKDIEGSEAKFYEPNQKVIESIDLIFDNGHLIRISTWADFIDIGLLEPNGAYSTIPWSELKILADL